MSAPTNNIIQKIPDAKSRMTAIPLNMSDDQGTSIGTKFLSAKNTSASELTVSDNSNKTIDEPDKASMTSSILPEKFNESAATVPAVHLSTTVKTTDQLDTATMNSSILPETSIKPIVTVSPPPAVLTSPPPAFEIDSKCPELHKVPNIDSMTQDEFLTMLTESCRYDKLVKPSPVPLEVYFQIDLAHVESSEHLVSRQKLKFHKECINVI